MTAIVESVVIITGASIGTVAVVLLLVGPIPSILSVAANRLPVIRAGKSLIWRWMDWWIDWTERHTRNGDERS